MLLKQHLLWSTGCNLPNPVFTQCFKIFELETPPFANTIMHHRRRSRRPFPIKQTAAKLSQFNPETTQPTASIPITHFSPANFTAELGNSSSDYVTSLVSSHLELIVHCCGALKKPSNNRSDPHRMERHAIKYLRKEVLPKDEGERCISLSVK